MAAPVTQKLIVEVVPPRQKAASGQTTEQAVRALARIIGRQIAKEQFRNQQGTSPEPGDQTRKAEAWRAQYASDAQDQ